MASLKIVRIFHSVYFDCRVAFQQFLIHTANGLNIADNEVLYNGYFTFQMIIDIAGACDAISFVICVGSPVIIMLFKPTQS